MTESSRDRVVRMARERTVALAYRSYATLLVAHERVRRARWDVELNTPWEPSPAAWDTLRFLVSVHSPKRRATRVLAKCLERCGMEEEETTEAEKGWRRWSEEGSRTDEEGSRTRTRSRSRTSEGGSRTVKKVPWLAWREALRAGIDLVAGVLVAHGAELPWGRGKRRAPRQRADFDAACRFLRDHDVKDEDLPSLTEILDSVDIPPLPPPKPLPDHRVTFFRGRQALSIDGVRMALPLGRELALLVILWERRRRGEVTPRFEHEIDWRVALEQLRRRIRKATGQNLLRAVVLTARGPTGGYRLAPGVRVRAD